MPLTQPQTAAIADITSAGLNTGGGIIAQALANKRNKEAAELAYKRGIKVWNMQNEYNTPKAQMERFAAAGLNPNLIYGQGNSGNASSGPTYNPPKYEGANPIPDFKGVAQNYLNAQQITAGIEQVQAATELTRQKTNTEVINQTLKGLGKDKLAIDINKLQALLPYQTEIAKNDAETSKYKTQELVTRIASMGQAQAKNLLEQEYIKKQLTQADIDADIKRTQLVYQRYSNELRKRGFTEKDNVVIRALGQAFDSQNGTVIKDAQKWAGAFMQWLQNSDIGRTFDGLLYEK